MAQEYFFNSPIFQEALKEVQLRMDKASERQVNVFGKNWWGKHFKMSQFARTHAEFDTILSQVHLTIAASTLNRDSERPVRGIDGFGRQKAEMLSIGHTYKMEAEDIRAIAEHMRMANGQRKEVVRYIVDKLWNIRQKAIDGVFERLDIIILGMLSNEGNYTITSAQDPNSPHVGKTLSFGFDASHAGSVTTAWTDTNKATVNVFQDIDDVVRQMEVKPEKILTSRAVLNYILSTDTIKKYINGTDMASRPITEPMLQQFLQANGLPTIEVVEKRSRVQNGDTFTTFNPWKENKLLFIPSNDLGTIEHQVTDADLGMKSPGVEYSKYNGVEVTSWVKGIADGASYTEHVSAGITATPVWDSALDCYSLNVNPT